MAAARIFLKMWRNWWQLGGRNFGQHLAALQ
jgi:hypothetical protein